MKLQTFLKRESMTAAEFAKKIGLSVHAVLKYKSGTRLPRRKNMMKIIEVTDGKVRLSDWYT